MDTSILDDRRKKWTVELYGKLSNTEYSVVCVTKEQAIEAALQVYPNGFALRAYWTRYA